MSQRELARRLGKSERTIRRWCGFRPIPKMAELAIRYVLKD
jgi:DNA-binding transcriptional regulator YiaG